MNKQPAAFAMIQASTAITRWRYARIAPLYDLLDWGMELRFSAWRRAAEVLPDLNGGAE